MVRFFEDFLLIKVLCCIILVDIFLNFILMVCVLNFSFFVSVLIRLEVVIFFYNIIRYVFVFY